MVQKYKKIKNIIEIEEQKQERDLIYAKSLDFVKKSNIGTWDRDANYNELKQKLIDIYPTFNLLSRKRVYCFISCLMLMNGLRISEAILAFKEFQKNKFQDEIVKVKVSKSGGIRNGVQKPTRYRNVKRCDWIESIDSCIMNAHVNKALDSNISCWLLKAFGLNAHSLRYAFVSHMLIDKGHSAPLVAKMIGHNNLLHILKYTQRKEAEDCIAGLV